MLLDENDKLRVFHIVDIIMRYGDTKQLEAATNAAISKVEMADLDVLVPPQSHIVSVWDSADSRLTSLR